MRRSSCMQIAVIAAYLSHSLVLGSLVAPDIPRMNLQDAQDSDSAASNEGTRVITAPPRPQTSSATGSNRNATCLPALSAACSRFARRLRRSQRFERQVHELHDEFEEVISLACAEAVAFRNQPFPMLQSIAQSLGEDLDEDCISLTVHRPRSGGERDDRHLARRGFTGVGGVVNRRNAKKTDRSGWIFGSMPSTRVHQARTPIEEVNDKLQRKLDELSGETQLHMMRAKLRTDKAQEAFNKGRCLAFAGHTICATAEIVRAELVRLEKNAAKENARDEEELLRESSGDFARHLKEERSEAEFPRQEHGLLVRRSETELDLRPRSPASSLRGSRSLSPIRDSLQGAFPAKLIDSPAMRGSKGTATEGTGSSWKSSSSFAKIAAYFATFVQWLREFPITIHPPPLSFEVHPPATAAGAHRGLDSGSTSRTKSALFSGMPRIFFRTHPDHNHIEARIGNEYCRLPLPRMLGRASSSSFTTTATSSSSGHSMSSQAFHGPNNKWCELLASLFGAGSATASHQHDPFRPHSPSFHPPAYAYPPQHGHGTHGQAHSAFQPSRASSQASNNNYESHPPAGYPIFEHADDHRVARPYYDFSSDAERDIGHASQHGGHESYHGGHESFHGGHESYRGKPYPHRMSTGRSWSSTGYDSDED